MFRRFADAMGTPELADDARFQTARDRSQHHQELDDLITTWTGGRPLGDIEATLVAADVPASRIFTIADIFADPHFAERSSIVRAPDPEMGDVAMAGVVPRLSETPGAVRHAGRDQGADTRAVLSDVLGLGEERLTELAAAGVIPAATKGDER